ncbi:MAG: hypothetical protein NTV34_12390, partial [Proteobacteria bacterium]|nr:hypothetical protein [Pseudomonadota bacterium]
MIVFLLAHSYSVKGNRVLAFEFHFVSESALKQANNIGFCGVKNWKFGTSDDVSLLGTTTCS